jgi:hypothetical protein
MPLVSQAAYARRRGISREAVRQRTVTAAGPIPVHGAKKLIDVAEADALWAATMSAQGAAHSPAIRGDGLHGLANGDGGSDAVALIAARAAVMKAEAELRQLRLSERRGQLLDRAATLARFFAVVRGMRDAWLAWPARIGAELAGVLGVEPGPLMIALEPFVRRQLVELADAQLDPGPASSKPRLEEGSAR